MAGRTESTITVAAPPPAVMGVIADFEAYPQWTTEVKDVEVLSRHGGEQARADRVHFVLDAGAIRDSYTLAYRWPDACGVSWSLVEAQLLTVMDGGYTLRANADGTTVVTYRLSVDVKMPMIGLIKRKAEKLVIDRALRGLKQRVES